MKQLKYLSMELEKFIMTIGSMSRKLDYNIMQKIIERCATSGIQDEKRYNEALEKFNVSNHHHSLAGFSRLEDLCYLKLEINKYGYVKCDSYMYIDDCADIQIYTPIAGNCINPISRRIFGTDLHADVVYHKNFANIPRIDSLLQLEEMECMLESGLKI